MHMREPLRLSPAQELGVIERRIVALLEQAKGLQLDHRVRRDLYGDADPGLTPIEAQLREIARAVQILEAERATIPEDTHADS